MAKNYDAHTRLIFEGTPAEVRGMLSNASDGLVRHLTGLIRNAASEGRVPEKNVSKTISFLKKSHPERVKHVRQNGGSFGSFMRGFAKGLGDVAKQAVPGVLAMM